MYKKNKICDIKIIFFGYNVTKKKVKELVKLVYLQ